jgi:dihydroflavonol-4-reductase
MRTLVLGATGHIGAHVTRALIGRGHAVRATYRNPRYAFLLDGLPVERLSLDLHDAAQLRQAVEGCPAVFVCGGYYPRWGERRAEAIARGLAQVRAVFEVLERAKPERIVFTSSAATLAPVPGRASTETDRRLWPLPRMNLYSTVKTAMERAVQAYADRGMPILITHPSICIGEYDAHAFSGRLVLMYAGRRWRVPVTLDLILNAVYTGDVGLGHVLAAERGRPGEHYLLVGEQMTMWEFAQRVARIAGVPPPRWRLPYPRFPTQRLDGAKTQRALGLLPTPVDEAIRRAVEWFRQHSGLEKAVV